MTFSICLPFYRKEHLSKVINNLESLDNQNFELIVGDDSGSNLVEKEFKKHFPGVKYFKNTPKLGEIKNSNKCFSLATKDWILLYHDDDAIHPYFINKVIEYSNNYKEIDIIYSARTMVNENNKIIGRQIIDKDNKVFVYKNSEILNNLLLDIDLKNFVVPIMTPGLLFKRKILKKTGGFDIKIDTHCDTDFIYKILLVSNKTLFINEELYISGIWFGNSGRTSSSKRGTIFEAQKGVLNNFFIFCKKQKIYTYILLKNKIYKIFAKKSIQINGPIIWLKLRYEGSFYQEIKIIHSILNEVLILNKNLYFDLQFYFIALVGFFIPKTILKILHKLFLKNYLSTK